MWRERGPWIGNLSGTAVLWVPPANHREGVGGRGRSPGWVEGVSASWAQGCVLAPAGGPVLTKGQFPPPPTPARGSSSLRPGPLAPRCPPGARPCVYRVLREAEMSGRCAGQACGPWASSTGSPPAAPPQHPPRRFHFRGSPSEDPGPQTPNLGAGSRRGRGLGRGGGVWAGPLVPARPLPDRQAVAALCCHLVAPRARAPLASPAGGRQSGALRPPDGVGWSLAGPGCDGV